MKSVFWIYGQEVLLRMPAVWDRKHLCPPGEEEFRSKVLSCKAPPWGPAPYLSIYFFWEKRYPSPPLTQYLQLTNGTPFKPSLELCITFSCCKCTVVKRWINQKSKKLSRLFHSHKILLLLCPFRSFYRPNWHRFPYPLIYFNHTWSLEKVTISQYGRRFPV